MKTQISLRIPCKAKPNPVSEKRFSQDLQRIRMNVSTAFITYYLYKVHIIRHSRAVEILKLCF